MPGSARLRASIQRSLDDHEDRVAAKRARIGSAGHTADVVPTPAQRLQALRDRIRQRVLGADERSGDSGHVAQLAQQIVAPTDAIGTAHGIAAAASGSSVGCPRTDLSFADPAARAAASRVAWHTASGSSSTGA